MSGPIELGWGDLAMASVLLVLNGVASIWLGLRLERPLLVAALRSVIQLSIPSTTLTIGPAPHKKIRNPWTGTIGCKKEAWEKMGSVPFSGARTL